MQFDLSGLQPDARDVAHQAVQVYAEHLYPWLHSIVAHGSAVKGGFIKGCSDIDFAIFVRPDILNVQLQLPYELAAKIQRDLALIDPSPFSYIQAYVHPQGRKKEGDGFFPGAYYLVFGDSNVPLANDEETQLRAHQYLTALDPDRYQSRISGNLLEHGGGKLHRQVRLLCTDVWPTLYNLLALTAQQPTTIWALPKPQAIRLTDECSELGDTIRRFYAAICRHYSQGETVDTAIASLEQGLAFLYAAAQWYRDGQKASGPKD